jgi:hypothetical protein
MASKEADMNRYGFPIALLLTLATFLPRGANACPS